MEKERGLFSDGIPLVAERSYGGVGSLDLIVEFFDSDVDQAIGRELSVRIMEHAGFPGDPDTAPLIGSDGSQIEKDGNPLTLADYINYAVDHHFEAVESILTFLLMERGSPEYETMRAAMLTRLNGLQA